MLGGITACRVDKLTRRNRSLWITCGDYLSIPRRVVFTLSEVSDSFILLEVICMVCIFCDVPREKHTPTQLDECVQAGAEGGWIGLSQF